MTPRSLRLAYQRATSSGVVLFTLLWRVVIRYEGKREKMSGGFLYKTNVCTLLGTRTLVLRHPSCIYMTSSGDPKLCHKHYWISWYPSRTTIHINAYKLH